MYSLRAKAAIYSRKRASSESGALTIAETLLLRIGSIVCP